MKCEYGCGKKAVFILKNGKHCCSRSSNGCDVIRSKNSAGLRKAYELGRKKPVFTKEHRKNAHLSRIKKLMQQPFELWGSKLINTFIFTEQNGKCLNCGISNWNDKPIVLQLDHINGDRFNNERRNLRLLCPNCHSQTETYCGKNINTGYVKVSDEQLWRVYIETKNIHQTLLRVGLAPKGGNYKRIYRLIERFS